jgi:S1-C subfamily serine protease
MLNAPPKCSLHGNASVAILAVLGAWLHLGVFSGMAQAQSAEAVFQRASPSIFVVESRLNDGRRMQGSAVVVAPELLATNCHTIGEGQPATLRRGRIVVAANVVHRDRWNDICVLVPQTQLGAPPAVLESAATLRVGAPVFAVGAPLGLELSLSAGLVSQLRAEVGPARLPPIQITAPISPGSSGGGLFDAEGRLVGITTSQAREGQNLNFAVPADVVADALASVFEVRACLARPNRSCLIGVAEAWTLYGEYRRGDGLSQGQGRGFGVLLNVALALRAEGYSERASALLEYWKRAGGSNFGAVPLAAPATAVRFHSLMAASLLDAGDRAAADAALAMALRAQERLPAEQCPDVALLRLVMELRGRPAMDLFAKSKPCDPNAHGSARELLDRWRAALALLAAGREVEGKSEVLLALRAAVQALRGPLPALGLFTVASDVTEPLRFAGRSGDKELIAAANAVTDSFEQALRRQPPRDEMSAAMARGYLLRLLALSERFERARVLALSEGDNERRSNLLADLLSFACAGWHEAICSAEWLEGNEGRDLLHPANRAWSLAWARALMARDFLRRGQADEAFEIVRSLAPRDLREQTAACVAAYWGGLGEFDRALAALSLIEGDDLRAEFLLLAVARKPADLRFTELSAARFDAYGIAPCWRMLR